MLEWYDADGICRLHMLSVFFRFSDEGQIRQMEMPMRDEHLRALLDRDAGMERWCAPTALG